MSESEGMGGRTAQGRRAGVVEMGIALTPVEWWSVVLAVVSLLLLHAAAAPSMAEGRPKASVAWIFLPHIVLIAAIIGGLRPLATVVQTFILFGSGIYALGSWANTVFGGPTSPPGYGLLVALQLALFVLCYRTGKARLTFGELGALGPRLALGGLAGLVCWFASGLALDATAAPARARQAVEAAARNSEAAWRGAEARVEVVTACLQQSPVTPDSQPYFPATLAELPNARCPEATQPAPEGFVIEYLPGPADSTGHHRTFHLSAHDSVISDTARTVEATETMVVRSWHGEGARRYPASMQQPLELLGRVGRCVEAARDTVAMKGIDQYPTSVAEGWMRGHCDVPTTADKAEFRERTTRGYYTVRYTPPPAPRPHYAPGGFTLLLEPGRDSLGRGIGGGLLSFFSDTNGVVHVTRRPRAATAADPAIPDCLELFGYAARDPSAQCREYRPRQRWGLSSELPTIALSMSGSGTLGTGEQLSLLPHFQPLLPQDLPAEARVRWDSGGRDTVLTKRRGVRFGTPIGNGVYFTFRHAWADTGMKRVEVRIRTVGGEEFETHEDIHVVPVHR